MVVVDNIKKLKKILYSTDLTIFLFHGVIKRKVKNNSIRNYNLKHICINKFEKYIKFLSKNGEAITLNDIKDLKKNYKKKYIITFDDGFHNNYKFALPILKKYKIPHIIYLTTDYIDKNLISWIDRIDIAIDDSKKKSIYSNFFKKEFQIRTKEEKIMFLNFIRNYCKSLKKKDLNKFSEFLLKDLKLKSPRTSNSDLDKKLNWEHVIKMSKNNLTEFGGHSHTHNILGHLNFKQYNKELKKSINLIKKKTKIKINHYSYPEGFKTSYNNRIIQILKNKGIKTGVTTHENKNIKTSFFKLNRIFVN